MKTMKTFLLATIVIAAGCDKKDKDGTGSAKVGAGPSETAQAHVGKMPAAFASWDMPTRVKAWQGAWAGEGGALGNKAAWSIEGTKVTYVDSRGEKALELAVDSPCTAKMVEKGADGSSSSTTSVYTLKDGQLVTGLGDAGQKKGDTAIVCGGGDVFVLDAKGCTKWDEFFGDWKSEPAECGWKKDGDKDVFFYKGMGGSESTLIVDGDVIWSEQLRDRHAAKHPDLAAAKTAQGL